MRSTKLVGYDNLAPIILLDKEMEIIPEPFRMQKNVLLIVTFSEYVKFIDTYLGKVNYLSTPTSVLKQFRNNNDLSKLYASFYADMAYGIAKELHYAEAEHKPATVIAHSIANAQINTVSDIERMYKDVKGFTENELYQHMEAKNFGLPRYFNKDNLLLWHYANVLLFFSRAPGNPWTISEEELGIC